MYYRYYGTRQIPGTRQMPGTRQICWLLKASDLGIEGISLTLVRERDGAGYGTRQMPGTRQMAGPSQIRLMDTQNTSFTGRERSDVPPARVGRSPDMSGDTSPFAGTAP